MERVFGIKFSEEQARRKETLPQPANAYLIDVDGVLIDSKTKEVRYPQLLREILFRLKRGEPIGLNTGRDAPFITDKILKPLEKMIYDEHGDKSVLHNLMAICEKGVVQIEYDEVGDRQVTIGDSASDFEMHEQLEKLGARSELVYVGLRSDLQGKDLTHVNFTEDYGYMLEKGTIFALV